MSYTVLIKKSAEKEMDKLQKPLFTKVKLKLLSLGVNPHSIGIKKLTNRPEYRMRVGDYRILFSIDDINKIVEVIAIGHRKDVYK